MGNGESCYLSVAMAQDLETKMFFLKKDAKFSIVFDRANVEKSVFNCSPDIRTATTGGFITRRAAESLSTLGTRLMNIPLQEIPMILGLNLTKKPYKRRYQGAYYMDADRPHP